MDTKIRSLIQESILLDGTLVGLEPAALNRLIGIRQNFEAQLQKPGMAFHMFL